MIMEQMPTKASNEHFLLNLFYSSLCAPLLPTLQTLYN